MKGKTWQLHVQFFRAISVLLVFFYHLKLDFLNFGYLGVDIFFVISGFVITSSLLKKDYSSSFEFLGNFYEKRIKRILPSLLVYVAIISTLICLVNFSSGVELKTGFTSIFGVSNIYLYFLCVLKRGSLQVRAAPCLKVEQRPRKFLRLPTRPARRVKH